MKIHHTLICFLLVIVLSPQSFAEGISQKQARKVAITFLDQLDPEYQDVKIRPFSTEHFNGAALYYVFNLNKGFIIISADNSVFPVLGYSFEENYLSSQQPPAFESWMNSMEAQIKFNIENQSGPSKYLKSVWDNYLSGNPGINISKSEVEPMLLSRWNQGCFYNTALPVDSAGPCNHVYTGCVATALGQILKYYNYPAHGIGYHEINTSYGTLSADFENTNYSWKYMMYNVTEENPAVAELLYHCVVGVNSQIFPFGTGAYDIDARDALVDYFGYDENAQFLWRDSYSGDWKEMLRTELDAGRPVIYGGVEESSSFGHTFICDGYQDTSFFHFNWGWGGQYNGYFYIDSLIAGGHHFDYHHDAIIGIEPDLPGIVELYGPENLQAEVIQNEVKLTWDAPTANSTLEQLGYNVYRNGELLNNVLITSTLYTDVDVPAGNHEYKVNSVFIGESNGPAMTVETYVSNIANKKSIPFQISPNPSAGFFQIHFDKAIHDELFIELYDLTGKKVLTSAESLKSKIITVNTRQPSGIYMLRIQAESFDHSERIIFK